MATRSFRLIRSGALAPAFNMAVDEALLLVAGPPTIRLYAWDPPALSLGYFQRYDAADHGTLDRLGFAIVRRLTGGGAIAHCGELTFAIATSLTEPPYHGPIARSYDVVHAALSSGLTKLGVQSQPRAQQSLASDVSGLEFYCFYKSTPADLVAGRRKLIGSAQRRHAGRVLHHGSLPLQKNPLTPEACSLDQLVGREVDFAEVSRALIDGLAEELAVDFVPGELTAEEHALATRLAVKYQSEAFLRRR